VVVLARVVIVSKCGVAMRRIALLATAIVMFMSSTAQASLLADPDGVDGYKWLKLGELPTPENSVNYFDSTYGYVPADALNYPSPLDVMVDANLPEFEFDDIVAYQSVDITDDMVRMHFTIKQNVKATWSRYFIDDLDFVTPENPSGAIKATLLYNELPGSVTAETPHSLDIYRGGGQYPAGTWEVAWMIEAAAPDPTALVNPGFEITEITGGAFPTTFGDWTGDVSEIVTAQNSIIPAEGDQMLHFLNTSPTGPAFPGSSSDVWQLVDMSSLATDITAGRVAVEFSALFNRIAGDLETDSEFSIEINALDGLPEDFLAHKIAGTELAISTATVITDGEFWTWEEAGTSVLLPAGTEYIAIMVNAVENNVNDGVDPEFAGHYADDVAMTVNIVEPGDLNGDGLVDAADAGIMFGNWGSTVFGYFDGNLNGDEYIDAADAGIMFANWTGDTGPAATTIPEPTALTLAALSLCLVATRRRR